MLVMDLAEDENFAFKHPYFFENFTFKFVNLKPELKENFENIVKSMGATVSDESQYVFTDIISTSFDQRNNYYSLTYLSNSILAEEPLEIEDYKFSNLVQYTNELGSCCFVGRYMLKNKSCRSYLNEYFCCKSCIVKRELLQKRNKQLSNQDNGNINEEPDLHIEDTNNLQSDKSMEIVNDLPLVQDEINNLSLDENSNDVDIGAENHNTSIQSLTSGISQGDGGNKSDSDAPIDGENHNASQQLLTNNISQENEVNEYNSDSSDLEITEILPPVNIEKPSCSTQDSKKPKTKKPSSIDKWKRVRTVSNSSDASSKSSDIRNATRKRTNKRQRLSPSPSEETASTQPSEETTNSQQAEETSDKSSSRESSPERPQNFVEILNTSMNRKEWWLYLPKANKNSNYPIPSVKLRGRGRDFTYGEKRLMIAYLVSKDLIDFGTSRSPWRDMLREGYMRDRTVESINNHYRKVILPNIESFKLPKEIQKKFKAARNLHQNCR